MRWRGLDLPSEPLLVCTERCGLEGGVVVTGGLGGGDGGKGAVGCVLRGWLVFVGRHGVGLLSEKFDGDEAR